MNHRPQQGIALIAAIFLIVIIGAAVVLLSTLSSRNTQQNTQNLLQFRAQLAAQAAIEYGIQYLTQGGSCSDSDLNSTVIVTAYSGFTVDLTCTSNPYNRPSQQITISKLTATAQLGVAADPDYVWAQIITYIEQ